jgi:hypothetical protein
MLTLLPLVSAVALASDDALVTDRPDIAESSLAVGRGVYQLEQGVLLSGCDGCAAGVGLPSLSRYGIGGGVELRLETPIVDVAGGSAAFPGAAVGFKWHVPTAAASLGVLVHADVDAAGDIAPIVKVAWDADLPAGFELGVNVGGTTAPGFGAPVALWATAVGKPLSDTLRVYAEASGEAGEAGAAVAVDAGFAYLFSDDVQWDASALYGAVGGGWSAGTGISVRFD